MGLQSPGVVVGGDGKSYVLEPIIFGNKLPESAPIGQTFVFKVAASNLVNAIGANGTPQQNAVAGDSFKWFNGAWYWVFHFGTANISGLSQVHSDPTLTGTGESSNLLKVAKPAAETGAQKNIPRFIKFAAEDSDTRSGVIQDGTFGLKVGANVYQANQSLAAVTTIDIPFETAAFGNDPGNPNTDNDAVDTQAFFDLFAADGVLERQPLFVKLDNREDNKTAYVKIGRLTKDNTHKKYVGTELTWDEAFQASSGGEHYDIAAYMNVRVFVADVVGIAAKYVALESLKPRAEDMYVAYTDGVIGQGGTDKTQSFVVTSDQSGVPQNGNAYRRFNNIPNHQTVSVWLSTQVWNSDPNSPGYSDRAITANDIGNTLYAHFLGKPGTYIKLNVVDGSVTVAGSGQSQHVYFQATTQITGTLQQQFNDVIKITSEVPNAFWNGVEIPGDVLSGLSFVERDGSNVTHALIAAIQGDNEVVTLANQFSYRGTAAGTPNTRFIRRDIDVNNNPINRITINIPDTDTQADTNLKRLLKLHAWVRIGAWVLDITSNASRSVTGSNITFSFNFIIERNSGSEPTANTNVNVAVVGSDVHRGELDPIAFGEIAEIEELTSIANDDWVLVYDVSAGKIKKITKSNFSA